MTTFLLKAKSSLSERKIPLTHFSIIIAILLGCIGWLIYNWRPGKVHPVYVNQGGYCPPPPVSQYRMADYKFTKPLLLTDILSESFVSSPHLDNIKQGILDIIAKEKSAGVITTASVYMREFGNMSHLDINDNEYYHPASLGKVANLLTLLRQSEFTPGFLDKKVHIDKLPSERGLNPHQDFPPGQGIKGNRDYTIRELIYHMIVESDNDANTILQDYIEAKQFLNLHTTLGLSNPFEGQNSGTNYVLTASEYSRFFRVLYNATYISNEDADWALSLLSKSEFDKAIRKAIPANIVVAHKFGEFGFKDDPNHKRDSELHEASVIYLDKNPILLTIMTRGKDKMKLSAVIEEIAKFVYEQETKPGV